MEWCPSNSDLSLGLTGRQEPPPNPGHSTRGLLQAIRSLTQSSAVRAAAPFARTIREQCASQIGLFGLSSPKIDRAYKLCIQIHPLIPGHLAELSGGPEKAGVGGSIRLWPPFRINDLQHMNKSLREQKLFHLFG
jgi:hypothetical protein